MKALRAFVAAVALALVVATFLPLWPTDLWWVRMMAFPRLQATTLLLLAGALLLFSLRGRSPVMLGLLGSVVAAVGFNAVKLAPYMANSAPTIVQTCPADRSFSVMVANVQLGSRSADALMEIIRERQPDLLLAMETDEWWDRQLKALSDVMPHAVQRITGSYYGIHLLSRLPLADRRTKAPVEQDAPALSVDVRLASGQDIRLIGLHPRPPTPGQSSTGRDAQLMWAALEARRGDRPVVVAGDLNAVPWEAVAERMRRIGRLVDPRWAHGYLATFDANSSWMKWPLDQVLVSATLDVTGAARLPSIGSDHYPYIATICARDGTLDVREMKDGDITAANDAIEAALRGKEEVVGD
ncbi:endonuclease/exonuclease/phosphatase family protein [Rhizobiaceae bacterium]|nr:endonuclease/exonuclease/phosphatase family protein [Rhizobiaceae bacterium]